MLLKDNYELNEEIAIAQAELPADELDKLANWAAERLREKILELAE